MNKELLKLAYQSLKRQLDGISKDSWIWLDFFEDEKVGFEYFKEPDRTGRRFRLPARRDILLRRRFRRAGV